MGRVGTVFRNHYKGKILSNGDNYRKEEMHVEEYIEKENLLGTLLKIEFKKYISKSNLAFNTSIGAIGFLICVNLFVFGVEEYSIPLVHLIIMSGIILFSMLPTTATSISFEGENFHILKALPIKPREIIKAKILLNLIINIPFLITGSVMLILNENITFSDGIIIIFTILFALLFTTMFALVMNMIFYKLDWSLEEEVINKSPAVFINLGVVLIITVVTWEIISYSLCLPLALYILATILISLFIKEYGEKLFVKIS